MNHEQQNLEEDIEQWLDSSEAKEIRSVLTSETGLLPGEAAIEERVISRVSSLAPSLRIKRLETGLRRWRVAAIISSVATVVFALALLFLRENLPPGNTVTQTVLPQHQEVKPPRNFPVQSISVSNVSDKVGETRKKLATLSPVPDTIIHERKDQ